MGTYTAAFTCKVTFKKEEGRRKKEKNKIMQQDSPDVYDDLFICVEINIMTVVFYLKGLLPALDAATLRGPQVTAPPLCSKYSQPAWTPECLV